MPVEVQVATAQKAEMQAGAAVTGVVTPFRQTTLAAEVAGRVVARSAEPGDPVEAGQVLIEIDDERARIALDEATARLAISQANAGEAASELKRGAGLYERGHLSEDQLESLRFRAEKTEAEVAAAQAALASARRAFADTRIQAPFAGIAETLHVQVGDYLKVGNPVAALVDFSKVRIRAGVTAGEAGQLADAGQATLSVDVLGGQRLLGDVRSVARTAHPETGTYAVEIWVSDPPARLREGMIATVGLPYAADTVALAVPATAVFRLSGSHHVFVVEADRARLRAVEIGRGDGTVLEIASGLAAGEQVVVSGQFALGEGSSVAVVGEG